MSRWERVATAEGLKSVALVPPEDLQLYLASSGWGIVGQLQRATVWRLDSRDGEFEVLLPMDGSVRDYPSRIFDLVNTLSVVEGRAASAVLDDIQDSNVDTVTFRLLPDGPPGTVPLFHGVDAIAGVGELVLATTYSAILERPMLVQGRRPPEVQNVARQVRLGTPAAGSWTVSARMDLSQPWTLAGMDSLAEQPLPRRLSLWMHRAVDACLSAAGEAIEDFRLEPFIRRQEEGVSANLCEALGRLGRGGMPFEMRFGWGRRLPSPISARTLRFEPSIVDVLRRAGYQLSQTLPDGPVTIEGEVARLRRDTGPGGQATITGVAETIYGETRLTVRVSLPDHLYERAVEAHRLRRRVRLVGVASRARVDDVHGFDLLPESLPGEASGLDG